MRVYGNPGRFECWQTTGTSAKPLSWRSRAALRKETIVGNMARAFNIAAPLALVIACATCLASLECCRIFFGFTIALNGMGFAVSLLQSRSHASVPCCLAFLIVGIGIATL